MSHRTDASHSKPPSSPRSAVALGVSEVSKTYPGTRALQGVSLSISRVNCTPWSAATDRESRPW